MPCRRVLRVEVQLRSFLISLLDWGMWLPSHPGHVPNSIGLGVLQSQSGPLGQEIISCHYGIRNLDPDPVP